MYCLAKSFEVTFNTPKYIPITAKPFVIRNITTPKKKFTPPPFFKKQNKFDQDKTFQFDFIQTLLDE